MKNLMGSAALAMGILGMILMALFWVFLPAIIIAYVITLVTTLTFGTALGYTVLACIAIGLIRGLFIK